MADKPDSEARVGWEPIYRGGYVLERYSSFAPPNNAVIEWANTLPPGASLLDLGCGAGRHLIYLGGRGFRMAGMDVAPTGLRMAQEACASRQISVDLRISDMTTIPWEDGCFDAVLSTSVVSHNLRAGMMQTIAEIQRVLKPGGALLVDFPATSRDNVQELRDLAAAGEIREVEPNTFIDERPDTDDFDGFLPHHYCDEADVRDLLRDFEILSLADDTDNPVSAQHSGNRGRWVAWARKPLTP